MTTLLLDELHAAATLAAATDRLRARRAAEVDEMRVVAHRAVLHPELVDARDPMTEPGGQGTPPVREFCLHFLT